MLQNGEHVTKRHRCRGPTRAGVCRQPPQVVVGRFSAVLQRDNGGVWRVSRLIAVADSTVAHVMKPE